jgi:hypothetical protein
MPMHWRRIDGEDFQTGVLFAFVVMIVARRKTDVKSHRTTGKISQGSSTLMYCSDLFSAPVIGEPL